MHGYYYTGGGDIETVFYVIYHDSVLQLVKTRFKVNEKHALSYIILN